MFDPISLGLMGAAAGGLLNGARGKDPLKGALLGGALGGGGGLLASAAMPAAGAAGGAAGGTGLLPTAAGEGFSAAGGGLGLKASAPSLIPESMSVAASGTPAQIGAANPTLWEQTMSVVKPVGTAVNTAAAVRSMMPQDQPLQITPNPVAVGQGGAQSLSQLVGSNASKAQQMAQEQAMRAQRRSALLGRMPPGMV